MQQFECSDFTTLGSYVGETLAVSDWISIDQQRIDQFAEVTGDRQWIHVDPERAARETAIGGTIAHGFLTLSLYPALMEQCLKLPAVSMSLNYGLDRVRFTAPLPAGSRIRAKFALHAMDAVEGGFQCNWQVQFEREGSKKPVCVAQAITRHYL